MYACLSGAGLEIQASICIRVGKGTKIWKRALWQGQQQRESKNKDKNEVNGKNKDKDMDMDKDERYKSKDNVKQVKLR